MAKKRHYFASEGSKSGIIWRVLLVSVMVLVLVLVLVLAAVAPCSEPKVPYLVVLVLVLCHSVTDELPTTGEESRGGVSGRSLREESRG